MSLELWDEDPGTVLAVVAHPDDLEYGAAAAVAKWTSAGSRVNYLLVTRGEAGIDGMPPAEAAAVREEEQRASAAIVGVSSVEFLDYQDGTVEYGLSLRAELAHAIRSHRPDTLLLFNHRDNWGFPGSRNSADHRAVGEAALDAAADGGNRWIFPSEDLEPHSVKRSLVAGSPQAHHAVDVTGYVDLAVASLAAHDAYLKGLGDHPMADPEFVRAMCEQTGEQAGVVAAVAVEVFGG
ncbi:MAG: PIG-L deacetylase family protein [Candidatus Nanopelagicales bacterium]